MSRAPVLLVALAMTAAAAEPFPEPYDSEPASRGVPLPAAAAAESFSRPAGFTISVVASEPDVQNPIAMAWDRRGRLWVAENYTYAEGAKRFDLALRDRVLVLEDEDGDGAFDRRTIFCDSVQMLTGIAVGHGGVWLMCPPRLVFMTDRDGDAVPDGQSETVLDGFEVLPSNYHNFANGLRFGPDGWLYGRCGHSCPAWIGRPGTPRDRRFAMEGGMWRYHVLTGAIEVLTTGTTNPWGHDWTAEGECFFINTVNGHLWHMIPGAHFAQANGIDPNPLTYELIDHHADHYHFDTGAGWQASRNGSSSSLGGGHAHSGCMIYEGTNWPAALRGRLFTLNFHGRRMNQEILERIGSGYVARHAEDLFQSGDAFFRGIDLASGPDGSVFVLDWSDTGECHERDGVHRRSGRIYRITFRGPDAGSKPDGRIDLDTFDDESLARLERHPDGWWAHHARQAIAERAQERPLSSEAVAILKEQFDRADTIAGEVSGVTPSALRVRALLSLHLGGVISRDELRERLTHDDEHVRTWAVRLLTESWPLDAALGPVSVSDAVAKQVDREVADLEATLLDLARHDPSALVRLTLASTLQRLPVARRSTLARALVGRAADATDHNLPLMVWYGLMPLAESDPDALASVVIASTWPTTRRLATRRLAERIESAPAALDRVLREAVVRAKAGESCSLLDDVVRGLSEGLGGWRRAPKPASWPEVVRTVAMLTDDEGTETPEAVPVATRAEAKRSLASSVEDLEIVFGGGRGVESLRATAVDAGEDLAARERALAALVDARPEDLRNVCEKLIGVRGLRVTAARGLALSNDGDVGRTLVEACRRSTAIERSAIIDLLVTRQSFATELLKAIASGTIAGEDVSAFQARQLARLGDPVIEAEVARVWGRSREVNAGARERIGRLAAMLSDTAESADLGHGRAVFTKHCGTCHALYGEGGRFGPDLTGSGRHDLGYLLENLVDPSAVVNRDWRLSRVEMHDGRVLGGVVVEDRDHTITLQTPTERLRLSRDDIATVNLTEQSPMPEGFVDLLSEAELRDLVAYLRHPAQVPLRE